MAEILAGLDREFPHLWASIGEEYAFPSIAFITRLEDRKIIMIPLQGMLITGREQAP